VIANASTGCPSNGGLRRPTIENLDEDAINPKGVKAIGDFVFLYRGGEPPSSAGEGQEVTQKWMAWFKELETSVDSEAPEPKRSS